MKNDDDDEEAIVNGISDVQRCFDLFFCNKYKEAYELIIPQDGTNMYATIAYTGFLFLEAVLTFDVEKVKETSRQATRCLNLCNGYRRKSSFMNAIKKVINGSDYNNYTTVEMHAELLYAETLFMKSILMLLEDNSILSFIRAGLKLKYSYNSFKECQCILHNRKWHNESHKIHFESGTRLGNGAFNLFISGLPVKIIKLLEFIGFSGNREKGMEEIIKCYNIKNNINHIPCVILLLIHQLIILYLLSYSEGNLILCEEILGEYLNKYSDSLCFLFFKGRLEIVKGNIKLSTQWYTKSLNSINLWPQFQHICFWELMWINVLTRNWKKAEDFADLLLKNSIWSQTLYYYHKAAIMLMDDNLTEEKRLEIDGMLREAPKHKQRIAGKSLPIEKFCVRKCERYFNQNNYLLLPIIELVFMWTLFRVIGKCLEIAPPIYEIIDKKIKEMDKEDEPTQFRADNKGLIHLLQGACLFQMKDYLKAEKALQKVLLLEKEITEDTYLVPYAYLQLGLIYEKRGELLKALQTLEATKKNYTGYIMENRLHFQINYMLMELRSKIFNT